MILEMENRVVLRHSCGHSIYSGLRHNHRLAHPSSSVVRLPVDEPALALTTTQDHAKDLCTLSSVAEDICRHYRSCID